MQNAYPITIYYDRSCPLCGEEMHRLKEYDRHGNLLLIDCSTPEFIPPEGAPDAAHMMQLLHARTAAGQWLVGVPAFQAAYSGAGFGFVADWMKRPLVARMLERIYPVVARYRGLIPGWLAVAWFGWLARRAARRTQACANGQCNI